MEEKATEAQLKDRDFTLIIDKSGSMLDEDTAVKGQSRWDAAKELVQGVAHKASKYDPDGLTLYLFNGNFHREENVTPSRVTQIWKESEPSNGTMLAPVLKHALDNYLTRKKAGKTKVNGEIIIVVTDGQPGDGGDVPKVIIDAANKIDKDSELGILFLQVGRDSGASVFLKSLDDDLEKQGAKFDIVDTKTMEEMQGISLSDAFLAALND